LVRGVTRQTMETLTRVITTKKGGPTHETGKGKTVRGGQSGNKKLRGKKETQKRLPNPGGATKTMFF